MFFHARIDLRERADRAGDGAGGNFLARRDETFAAAREFRIGISELDAEGGRLGVNAVLAADGRRHLMFQRALLERDKNLVHVGDQNVGGAHELHVKGRVENVR